jgi:sulfhydrogenase subunit beta (sulfur reductase)
MAKQNVLCVSKTDLLIGLNKALKQYKIAALTKKKEKILFDYISNVKEIVFNYTPTVLSPKKFFFPQDELILKYSPKGEFEPVIKAEPLILFGVRPCDINGIKILNEAFADTYGDPNYLSKKEASLVIGIDCTKKCDKKAFCFKVNSQNASTGADILLKDIGEIFLVNIISPQGKKFVLKYLKTDKADLAQIVLFEKEKQKSFGKEKPFKKLEKLPEIFEKYKNHKVWTEEGNRCLSCGSCIMVCPTCYCFDIKDDWALNLQKGERKRKWDACMLNDFAKVVTGENFRPNAEERLKHRINRKFNYLMIKHKQAVCVGCGRCVRACLAEISPKKIAEVLIKEA